MNQKNTHNELCTIAGKWLNEGGRIEPPSCTFVAIEPHSNIDEIPDVFGWCSWTSVLIEVKVSVGDFLADFKKPFRITPNLGVGEFRFYCCPEGLIGIDEVPKEWGLLWCVDDSVIMKKLAVRQEACLSNERTIISSVMRREGLYKKVFDYRKKIK